MINTTNIQEARNLIKAAINKPIIVRAQSLEFNRKILEYAKFDVLLFTESQNWNKKDKIKQLDTGFNHVLAKIAAKNNIALGIDLKEIKHLTKKEKAICLARLIQNIKVCRKAKCKLKILNYQVKINTQNLLISLGSSTLQAKEAV